MKLAEKALNLISELEEEDKTLVRGKDRLVAQDSSGKEFKIVAVEDGKYISLRKGAGDGEEIAKHPKTASSVDKFDYGLARNKTIKRGSLKIMNEEIQEGMTVIKKQLGTDKQTDKLGITNDKFVVRTLNLINGLFGSVKYDPDKRAGLIPTTHQGELPFSFGSDGKFWLELSGKRTTAMEDEKYISKVIGKLMEIDKFMGMA